jgi:hypothetical protein
VNSKERQMQIERMRRSVLGEQIEAAWTLAQSADPAAVAATLEVLEQSESHHPEVVSNVIDGLVAGAPATLTQVLAYLEQTPLSLGGKDCVYVLGEVAYRQGSGRDPRIVPALLKALAVYFPLGTRAVSTAVAALRECARSGPLPDVEEAMLAVLSLAETEKEPYSWALENVLEVLYANHGERLLPELKKRLRALPSEHKLALTIQDFLDEKGERQ